MTQSSHEFLELLSKRILVLDGAMGSVLQRYGLSENDFRGDRFASHSIPLAGNNDLLSLTRPQIIGSIHDEYLRAGANIIETNTFNANTISQSDYGLESIVFELNETSARIARSAADAENARRGCCECFVAGSVGPTNRTGSMSPDVTDPGRRNATFDDFVRAYTPQIRGLVSGGADLLLFETSTDTLNTKAAIYAAEEVFAETGSELPIMISATVVDLLGRMLAGQTIEAFFASIRHARTLCAIGLNCSFGAEHLAPFVQDLSGIADCAICFYPNAGLPNSLGEYEDNPTNMADRIGSLARAGLLNIAGGCCGTTPEYISAIVNTTSGLPPRKYSHRNRELTLSGLEMFEFRPNVNFVNIGERTNVAGSKRFAHAVANGEWETASAIARKQIEDGAEIIDICVDMAMLDGQKAITQFLNTIATVPSVARVPVMIDSSDWEVIRAGLKCLQGKCIVNSISLKSGEEQFLAHAGELRRYGAAALVMAFDESGQAVTLNKRIEVLRRAFRLLTEHAGWDPADIILDPNVLAIGTGISAHNSYAVDFIETVRQLKPELHGARFSGGISNLSYAFRGNNSIRRAMHSVFLYHAIGAGLDMGIVNPSQLDIYEEIAPEFRRHIEDLVLNRSSRATEALIDFCAANPQHTEKHTHLPNRHSVPVCDRIEEAIVRGNSEFIEEDLLEALHSGQSPLGIIDGALMEGINRVGELFGEGKMFLPQVVQSARVMKKATGILEPYFEHGLPAKKRAKIVLATVHGDVHDIGKNILSVVLSCNNFEVIDLGVMVHESRIVESARENGADFVGLSGLITPSLSEMVRVAEEMEREGLRIPLLLGGAATSPLHTAVRIAPAYSGTTIHVRDASQAVGILSNLLNPAMRFVYADSIRKEFERIRAEYYQKSEMVNVVPISEARAHPREFDRLEAQIPTEALLGTRSILIPDVEQFIESIDFSRTTKAMGCKTDCSNGDTALEIIAEARAIAASVLSPHSGIGVQACGGAFRAYSEADTIYLETKNGNHVPLPMLRRQTKRESSNFYPSLADFVAPKELATDDYLGLFCVSVGSGAEAIIDAYRSNGDNDKATLYQLVLNAIAEAYAEFARADILHVSLGLGCRGIAPAPGYAAMPDHSLKREIIRILDATTLCGTQLTDNFMMLPSASACGIIFPHPEAAYFPVGTIGEDQMADYARRRGFAIAAMRKFLSNC